MSKPEVKFAKPTHDLVRVLASNMRGCDRTEVWLSHGYTPLEAAQISVGKSKSECYAAVAGDVLLAIFGVGKASPLALTGCPWFLGTEELAAYHPEMAKLSQPVIEYFRGGYTRLENYVHDGNVVSIRWLKRCGFTIEPEQPYGPYGALFHRFWMPGKVPVCAPQQPSP